MEAKDVMLPLAVFFTLNFVVLMVWSFVDPLQWNRKAIDGEEWNTYGVCESESAAGRTLQGVIIAINVAALVGASYQAYNARDLSDDFSESKSIGIALYSWVQLLIVAVPVLFLTSEDSVEARFFLQCGLVFAVCMTMLLCLFGPIMLRTNNDGASVGTGAHSSPHASVHISGLEAPKTSVSRSGFGYSPGSNPGLSSDSVHSYTSAPESEVFHASSRGDAGVENHDDYGNAEGVLSTQPLRMASEMSSDNLPENGQEAGMPTIAEGSKESMTSGYMESSSSLKAEEAAQKPNSDPRRSTLVRIDESTQSNGEEMARVEADDVDEVKGSDDEGGNAETFEGEFQTDMKAGEEEGFVAAP